MNTCVARTIIKFDKFSNGKIGRKRHVISRPARFVCCAHRFSSAAQAFVSFVVADNAWRRILRFFSVISHRFRLLEATQESLHIHVLNISISSERKFCA